jgi:hypothetical protein
LGGGHSQNGGPNSAIASSLELFLEMEEKVKEPSQSSVFSFWFGDGLGHQLGNIIKFTPRREAKPMQIFFIKKSTSKFWRIF